MDMEPSYHSELRTVDEIEIRPFFICEIGLTFLQLKTIERFQWVRFQFRWLFWTHCGNVVQKVPEMFDKCNFHFFHSTLVHIDITTFLDWGSFTFWRCQGAWGHWQSVTRWGYLSWWDEPQSEWPQTPHFCGSHLTRPSAPICRGHKDRSHGSQEWRELVGELLHSFTLSLGLCDIAGV